MHNCIPNQLVADCCCGWRSADVTEEVSLLSSRMGGMDCCARDIVMVVPIGLWLVVEDADDRRLFSIMAICISCVLLMAQSLCGTEPFFGQLLERCPFFPQHQQVPSNWANDMDCSSVVMLSDVVVVMLDDELLDGLEDG